MVSVDVGNDSLSASVRGLGQTSHRHLNGPLLLCHNEVSSSGIICDGVGTPDSRMSCDGRTSTRMTISRRTGPLVTR